MGLLTTYQTILFTIVAFSTTGLFVLRYLGWREYRKERDRQPPDEISS